MAFSVLLVSLIAHVLFALDCERVELHSEGLIIPTTYCYAGSFSANSITYSSTSFMYQCIDGTPYYVEYTNAECEGEGTKTSVKDNDDYSYWCGIDQCDVVHLTLYDGVSNADCVKAENDAALLDSYERFSGAFLLDYCNYMSEASSLKLTCAGNEAKLLTYALSDCKNLAETTLMNTSVAVDCNTTTETLGTLTALSAQCELPSEDPLDCERVQLMSEGLIIPTTYCYSGSFSAGGISYSSTSFMYQCISGTPYYVEYTNAECEGEGTKTSVKDNDDYSYWCGIDKCDVVHLTLYDGVSNAECVKAENDGALLDSYERFSGAFLLDYCNYMSDAMSLKLTCDGDEAKLLTYADTDCKTLVETTLMDTSVAVDCNTTTYALGTLTALNAQCLISFPEHTTTLATGGTYPTKKNNTIIVIVVVVAVVLIAAGIAMYCYFKKKKEAVHDNYSIML